MKKLILFAAILFAGVSVVKAEGEGGPIAEGEGGPIAEGKINLTLKLQPFQSIVIGGADGGSGSAGNNVFLNYETADDYEKGVTTTMNNHLKIVAAGKYAVKVEAKSGVFSDELGAATTYDLSGITLTAKATDDAGYGDPIDLSEGLQTLISSNVKTGTDVTYDVAYKGAGNNQYVAMLKDNAETIYTTEITYTIVAE